MWCGAKYSKEHTCVKTQLYQILVDDTIENEVNLEEYMDCEESMEDPGNNGEVIGSLHAISLHALVETEGHQAMRIVAKSRINL